MPKYEVSLAYRGTNTYLVEAANPEAAEMLARQRYSAGDDGDSTGSEWDKVEGVEVTPLTPPAREPRAFCDIDQDELEAGVKRLSEDYARWAADAESFKPDVRVSQRLMCRRAFDFRLGRLFCDEPTEPRLGDEVITLKGDCDDDCDGQRREAPTGTRGRVDTIDRNAAHGPLFHVLFENGTWVVLELYKICDPEQYTWTCKENT